MVKRNPPTSMFVAVAPWSIGENSYVSEYCHIAQGTSIGNYCSIATHAIIGAMPHHLDWLTTFPVGQKAEARSIETRISHDVWIGANAIVLAGVKVGLGAVIGAGAVVTKDVEPYAIVAGNPAKLLRYRFPKETRDALLNSHWWQRPIEEVKQLPLHDPMKCLELLRAA